MSTFMEWSLLLAIVIAASAYLLRHGIRIYRGIRDRKNPSCEGCGMAPCCTTLKSKAAEKP